MVAFTACDNEIAQEEITPEILTEEEMPEVLLKALPPDPTSSDPAEMRRRPCFRFVFPVQVVLRDGTVITASDAEDLRAAYRRIRDAGVRANFVYPFDVQLANGNQVTIENFRTLRRLHRSCRDINDDVRPRPCFNINYPISVVGRDTTIEVNSWQQFRRLNQAFSPHGVSIVYPITVTLENDRVLTLNGERELYRLRNACVDRGDEDDREPCYSVLFPVTLNIGQNTVTVVSRVAWREVVEAAGEDADVSLAFPITIVNRETEEQVIVESVEDWRAARDLCD
jgi:CO dehydrogenase/acetyl-CoA synthase gamma subunit (corrinoid Fe-S protein)